MVVRGVPSSRSELLLVSSHKILFHCLYRIYLLSLYLLLWLYLLRLL